MNCENCIHCKVCDFWENEIYSTDPEKWDGEICKFYENKKAFVRLPLYIGQPVWKLQTWLRSPAEIIDSRVSMIQQKANKSWKFRISNKRGTDDFSEKELGKYIFLTKEAAEEALIATNKNN